MQKMPDPSDGCRRLALAAVSLLALLCLSLVDMTWKGCD